MVRTNDNSVSVEVVEGVTEMVVEAETVEATEEGMAVEAVTVAEAEELVEVELLLLELAERLSEEQEVP